MQGLYLGFDGLRHIDDAKINDLWNTPDLEVLAFQDSVPPTSIVTKDTLFNLGTKFIAAGREVAFAAKETPLPVFTNNIHWSFLHANGPETMYNNYRQSLNFMVRRRTGDELFEKWGLEKNAFASMCNKLTQDSCLTPTTNHLLA